MSNEYLLLVFIGDMIDSFFIFSGLVPFEAVGLIIWWAYSNIAFTKWYELAAESLASTFLEVRMRFRNLHKLTASQWAALNNTTFLFQWSILLTAILMFNLATYLLKCSIVKSSTNFGHDPHDLSSIPPAEAYKRVREIPLYSQDDILSSEDTTPMPPS